MVLGTSIGVGEGQRVRNQDRQDLPLVVRAENRGGKGAVANFDGAYSTIVLPPLSPLEPVLVTLA